MDWKGTGYDRVRSDLRDKGVEVAVDGDVEGTCVEGKEADAAIVGKAGSRAEFNLKEEDLSCPAKRNAFVPIQKKTLDKGA